MLYANDVFNAINSNNDLWYDSGCNFIANREVKKVLLTLDVDSSIVDYC